jgi:glucosamine 6-phosphate synthetase-like amidotransferase/phosphosugar isomerase protein
MCGVFGFVAKDDEKTIDLPTLKRIAVDTESRGPHAWGMAWIDSRGRLNCFKQTGRVSQALGLLAMARDARALIGHCRFATQGDPANNLNNHPFAADGGWIVHNGIIRGYEQLVADFDLHPVTECDSEALALLIEKLDGSLLER